MSNFIFSNEQKSIFEYDKNDVIQVNGSPGSGKTLVAIKKAILLAEKYNKKVLFLYYNKSLGYEIRRLFGTFDEYSLLKNKIVIDHIDNYIKNCLTSPALREKLKEIKGRKNKYPKNKFDRESRMSLAIDEYKKHNKNSSFYRMDRDFLLSEIDWLRNCDFTKEEYLKNKRLERGSLKKIDLSQKQEVLDILGYYRKVENEVEYFQDYHDYMISALYYLRRKDLFLDEQNYFDHIIIDEDDFINLDFENNNFDIIFGRELSTNENITTENESKRYDIIKEIKEFEKRIISEIQSLRKETSLKFEDLKKSETVKKESKNIEDEKDKEEPKIIEKEVIKEVEKIIKVEVPVEKIIEKEKIVEVKVEVEKEVNKIEKLINPEKIEKDIEEKFPRANKTTQNELIGAEINYNINYINKDNQALLKRMNLKYNTVAYIIALETELRDYYSKMCSAKIISEKFNDSITLGGLILKLKENPVFKIPVDDFYKKDLLNLRNESLHVHADNAKFIDFEQLKEVRKTIMNDLLKRFILGFHSLKIKNKDNTDLKKSVINAKMVTRGESYDSSIKKYKNFKGFYSCILEDINGKQYGAVTKFTYELEKFYKFICEDCYIDGTTVKNIIGREK